MSARYIKKRRPLRGFVKDCGKSFRPIKGDGDFLISAQHVRRGYGAGCAITSVIKAYEQAGLFSGGEEHVSGVLREQLVSKRPA